MIRDVTLCMVALLGVACAGPDRDNVYDPGHAPIIEMDEPVVDGTSVLVQWRYVSEERELTAFVVRKLRSDSVEFPPYPATTITVGSAGRRWSASEVPIVARLSVRASTEWRTLTVRDETIWLGAQVLYQVSAVSTTDEELSSVVRIFRQPTNP